MSLHSIAFIVVYITGCIVTLSNPFYGLITYLFEFYNSPNFRWWGDELPHLRWSLMIATITLVSFIINGRTLKKIKMFERSQIIWLAMLLVYMSIITMTSAVSREGSQYFLEKFFKLFILLILIARLVRTENQFRIFIWAHIIGAFLIGWEATMNTQMSGVRLSTKGIAAADIIDDNFMSLHLLTTLPFIGTLFLAGKKWEKIASIIIAPFIINTMILSSSRGAFLSLIVAVIFYVVLIKGRIRLKAVVCVMLAGVLFFYLTDERFWTRQDTITQEAIFQEGEEGNERILYWKAAIRIIKDNPFGVGGEGYDMLTPQYIPEITLRHNDYRTVHNTYLLVASEWGIPGFICFMGFLLSTIIMLHRQRSLHGDTKSNYYIQSINVEVAIIGFLFGCIFVNRLYAEVLYWLMGISIALNNIIRNKLEEERTDTD